ncbi:MAG TPA: DegT/DnrJ/EryC1/StrS family aminotransferase [Solirubrobacterales bacterium]|nr:DegT/DnrJ/EryC1/StrS family aminotransferase [Solirubrobacterales bacterium]
MAAMLEAYRSGWLSPGPETARLEEAFCEYTGAGHAVAISSCSAGLHLACLAAELGPGDRVIVPSLTFTSTVAAAVHVGATPCFADIAGPTEPWLSAEAVAAAIDERTRGVITMHYGGHLGETIEIVDLARERDLVLIEDAAHAAGSWLGGRHAGTFGTAGVFSFSASKNLGIGEGGMLVTDDSEIAARAGSLSWHGLGSQIWQRHHQSAPVYELGALGFNYRFDDPRAALVRSRLQRLEADNRRRAAIDGFYRQAFDRHELIEPTAPPPAGERFSHCLFTAVIEPTVDREWFRQALAERGVQSSVHYPLLHRGGVHAQPGVRLPHTEEYGRRCVTLPLYPQMEQWQVELVAETVCEVLSKARGARAAA